MNKIEILKADAVSDRVRLFSLKSKLKINNISSLIVYPLNIVKRYDIL